MSKVIPAVPTVKLLINGEFVESSSTQWQEVVNPATQQVLARVPLATSGEVAAASHYPSSMEDSPCRLRLTCPFS